MRIERLIQWYVSVQAGQVNPHWQGFFLGGDGIED